VNRHFETVRPATGFPLEERGRGLAQGLEHTPEELFGHVGRAHFIGVGKAVAAGRGGAANLGQSSPVELQTIAHVIQPDGMRYLGMKPRNDMTPIRKVAGFAGGTGFAR